MKFLLDQIIPLPEKEVHLWQIKLSKEKTNLEDYWVTLSEEEQKKAEKFRFTKDKTCSIIARGALRKLIAGYTRQSPTEIDFNYTEKGKPFVNHLSNIRFNISHSEDVIVIAFIKNYKIGVDVERVKQDFQFLDIVQAFFSKEEITELLELKKKNQPQGFYNCWTRKEAFIKAEGSGLSFPLNEFVVSLKNTNTAKLSSTKWDETEKEKWWLETFTPFENYVGAIAVRGEINKIRYFK